MIKADQIRKIEILVNNEWTEAQLVQIEAGDIFRMTNPDGTRILCTLPDASTTEMYIATGQARIDCEPFVIGGIPDVVQSEAAPSEAVTGASDGPIPGN